MKVIFDHQIFSSQKHGGVSKYFVELIRHLPKEYWRTTTFFSNNEYVRHYRLFHTFPFFPGIEFPGKGRIISELNKPYSIIKLGSQKYDVFHQTNFDPYCIKPIGSKPMVTTFHDINFATIDKNESRVVFQRKSLNRADKIVAISHNTKKDLVEHYSVEPSKIEVIHHGVSQTTIPGGLNSRILKAPYLLFVGLRREFKNFKRFIEAFAVFHHKYPDLHVICTRNDFSKAELILFEELKIRKKIHHINADEITMARLYRDAELFVFPSLYEGFGMPILEAMINNCPVAISSTSCFPEIAGDAASYFDPYQVDDIVYAILKVLDNPSYKKRLIQRGKARALEFTWEKSVERHVKLYESLL
ncbi:glycosyltransferase family 4 protein [Maribellus maritimus]|uniref:glycosyltransferase family 4 protein n=1 Tax=Maribellus maritimus TaxID=2870838 RepID=UPI001EEA79B3|nr:glycosyltransferase family 1 protein [Maribellus maritimus]MCG6188440.1 glycosyltransferase family 4 protein [Maribellus maritimus]